MPLPHAPPQPCAEVTHPRSNVGCCLKIYVIPTFFGDESLWVVNLLYRCRVGERGQYAVVG